MGGFAQGGQIAVHSDTWTKVDTSKLSAHNATELGVYKLEGFSSGGLLFWFFEEGRHYCTYKLLTENSFDVTYLEGGVRY